MNQVASEEDNSKSSLCKIRYIYLVISWVLAKIAPVVFAQPIGAADSSVTYLALLIFKGGAKSIFMIVPCFY